MEDQKNEGKVLTEEELNLFQLLSEVVCRIAAVERVMLDKNLVTPQELADAQQLAAVQLQGLFQKK
jgi:hypothetical protein